MDQNLLSHSRTDEAEVDRSLIKIIMLGALGVVAAAASGFFVARYADAATNANFWLLSGALTVLLVVVLLQTFFVKSFSKAAALDAAYAIALLAPLAPVLTPFALAGGGAALAGIIWGNFTGNRELKDRIKIRFFRISRLTLGKAATGLSLFLALYYLGTQGGSIAVSQPLFERLVLPGASITERFFPGVSLSGTFRTAVTELAMSQAKAIPGFEILPPAAQRELLNRAAAEVEVQATRLLGITVRPDARVVDLLYESFQAKFAGLGESGKQLALLGIGAVMFFAIRGLGILFVWAAIAVGFVIYEILIALGFATIVLEGGSREIIIL
ncbi:MAG: hypothetical protein HYT14_02825 [Candidatus Liptonbacteria bacterium]|nr:hypothetical protein [Candidatus Liptonbacteria bacterium]